MSAHGSSKKEEEVTYKLVDDLVLNMMTPPTKGWYFLVTITVLLALTMFSTFARQFLMGLGANTGINNPIGWGFFITNFVFWVGIAHSGTLISAVLYLFRAKFRMPIYRIAEAMTVFAVCDSGPFPDHPYRSTVVRGILVVPISEPTSIVAELQVASDVGRFRDFYLLHRLFYVFCFGSYS